MTTTKQLADACRSLIESGSLSRGQTLLLSVPLNSLAVELAESQLPIKDEWLRKIGFISDGKSMLTCHVMNYFVHDNSWLCFGHRVYLETRGDVLRLMAALKIEPKREV